MRPVRVLDNDTDVRRGAGGILYLQSPFALSPYPERLTDKLDYWAGAAPDRIFLADRYSEPGPPRGSRPTSEDAGRDPRNGPGENRDVGRDPRSGPGGSRDVGRDPRSGPGGGRDVGRDPRNGPGENRDVGRDPRSGPDGSRDVGRDPRSGPGGGRDVGRDPRSGPGGSRDVGRDPRSGPDGSRDVGRDPRSGPDGSRDVGRDPRSGPAEIAWRTLTFAQTRDRARAIAQSLLDRGLNADRPIVILSGNSVEHALLALGAMYAGVYYAPIAPAYSLQAGSDFAALRHVFARVRPSLVFADDGAAFEGALDAVMTPDMELVSVTAPSRRAWTPFGALTSRPATPDVDDATKRVGPDTIAKVLFTSGSTGHPKGVINTQRMLCSNQQQILDVMQFLGDEPPVLCDWLPWNHTAGGNHNFGIVLYNGGTMYIDDGKPVAALFNRTLRNLREIACTNHFTVPRFYEMLLPHLQRDAELREVFFRRLRLIFYAAAGLGQRFWDQLRDVSIEACGEELLIMTGMGMTESAPFLMCTGPRGAFAGMIGLPVPGVELKLVPVGEKVEGRVRGPNMTPGYLGEPGLTQNAFDDEGFYCTGDALSFVDPADPAQGLVFEGRLAEDFKLSSGTWVSVGPLRARILAQGAGLVQDVVIAAPDRPYAAALIFPNMAMCRDISGSSAATPAAALAHPVVQARFASVIDALAAQNTGTSTFVARAIVLDEPPSSAAREITDKGSINMKAVLHHRRELVDELYEAAPSARVIVASSSGVRL